MNSHACRALTLVLAATFCTSGCYKFDKEQITQTLKVTTRPSRAYVWTQDSAGKQDVGRAPVEVKRTYQVTRRRYSHWLWAWTALFAGATGGGIAMVVADDDSGSMSSGQKVGGIVLTTLAGCLLLPSLIGNIIGEVQGDKKFVTAQKVTIGASAPGHGDRWAALSIPSDKKSLHISLPPTGDNPVLGGLVGTKVSGKAKVFGVLRARRKPPIVAVFNVQDASKKLEADLLDQLTEYLATQLAATSRYRIVPRDRIREQLVGERRKSYRVCYDQACQIELGKAVAAQKSLSTRLLRVGERCAVTAALFDLKTETTEAAASVDTTCSTEALLGAMRDVVKQLAK
jgi:hypothetical protein